jgi:hypothetical protein
MLKKSRKNDGIVVGKEGMKVERWIEPYSNNMKQTK